ncbi:MAG: efflux RND transporter periplasmic adaptor subunit [Mangrovicoccus sp.]|nr:efflux RND transporter periplasmic adaptor subunit [Mangrovicoccus sp.]
MNAHETVSAAKSLSRPPLLPSEIEGQPIALNDLGKTIDITLGGKSLLGIEHWQYHVLCGLNGHNADTLQGLHDLVQDRFGRDLDHKEIAGFFRLLKTHELIDPAEQERLPVVNNAVLGKNEDPIEEAKQQSVGVADTPSKPGIVLFRPLWLLKLLTPIFWLGNWVRFLLPVMLVVAVFETVTNWSAITEGFQLYFTTSNLATVVAVLVSLNLVISLLHACVAHSQGVTVSAVVIRFLFSFFPQIGLWMEDTEKLSRQQAIRLHGAPLIIRLFFACSGVLTFVATRHLGGVIPEAAVVVAVIASLSFLFSACPFLPSNGYRVMAEFLDEPHLRAKAFKALWSRFSRSQYQKADPQVLLAYALVSMAFALLLAVLTFLVFGRRLLLTFGADGLVIGAIVIVLFLVRVWSQLKKTNEIYWKNYRFERWRDRTLPSQEQRKLEDTTRITPWTALKVALLVALAVVLMQPYEYRPSGPVTMLPRSQNSLSSDVEGIVEEVYFEGGEFLEKGTPVARLATQELEAQMRILQAEQEQAQTNYDFVRVQCERNEALFEKGAISDAQLQRYLSECSAAEAELEILKAQMDRVQYRIDRSTFRMPFDGQLGTLYLQERLGSYLKEGVPVATVRDTSGFKVQFKARESDLALVHEGSPLEVRVYAYPDEIFYGEIVSIDPDVESGKGGQLVDMVGKIENRDGKLRSGMTGLAKADGIEKPIWRIITQGLYRFFVIDLWAWLP